VLTLCITAASSLIAVAGLMLGGRRMEAKQLARLGHRAPDRAPHRFSRHTWVVSQPDPSVELMAEEERLWSELHDLVGSLPEDKLDEPGYFVEGWSAKDLVAHIGSWLAEAGVVLERIRFGTYRPEEIDIDAMNRTFYEAMHDVAYADVLAQGIAARNRMLRAWRSLPDASPAADRWISKAGSEHYAEHLPRLRAWVAESP
jgi:hypothetical protein